jgi:Tfp pilus assembly protein PilO
MKTGKIKLTQKNLVLAAAAIIVVIALVAYFLFLTPLVGQIKKKHLECKAIESNVIECRNIIETLGKGGRLLLPEEEVSYTIDELTRLGKARGVNFVSMIPQKIEKSGQYRILPVEIQLESTYRQLGSFLGSLDNLEKGLIRMQSFDVTSGKDDMSKLISDLILEVYIAEHKDEK